MAGLKAVEPLPKISRSYRSVSICDPHAVLPCIYPAGVSPAPAGEAIFSTDALTTSALHNSSLSGNRHACLSLRAVPAYARRWLCQSRRVRTVAAGSPVLLAHFALHPMAEAPAYRADYSTSG